MLWWSWQAGVRRGGEGQGRSSMPHPSWPHVGPIVWLWTVPDTSLREGQLGAVILGLAFTWLSTRTSSKHTVSSTPHCPTLNREEPGGWISWYLENSESCLQVSGDSVKPVLCTPTQTKLLPLHTPKASPQGGGKHEGGNINPVWVTNTKETGFHAESSQKTGWTKSPESAWSHMEKGVRHSASPPYLCFGA